MSASKKSKGEILIPSFLGLIGVIIAAVLAYRTGVDSVRIPLNATQTAEARLASTTLILTPHAPSPAPLPSNLVQRIDFETGLPPGISLGICDNSQSRWYEYCYEAPQRLQIATNSFTGANSLACQIESSPDKELVYTLRIPIEPPLFVDTATANFFSTDTTLFEKFSLALRLKGENTWLFSDLAPRQSGWLRLLVDLQGFKVDTQPTSEIAIEEVHIDIFVKQSQQAAQSAVVFIDDIEFLYPLAKSYKTDP